MALCGVSTRASGADDLVVVVGAGLAGLRTADLLRKAGTPVVVLEAQARSGGRVLTLRAPFDEGSHAEAGPMRFASAHRAVLRAVRAYGLPLVSFEAPGAGVAAVGSRPASTLEGPSAETIARALRESYRAGEKYGSAFGKLLTRIFAGRGLIQIKKMRVS